jgi:hypothetical protein
MDKMKMIKRKSTLVVRTNIEFTVALNNRLEQYVNECKLSKRQVIEMALSTWLNDRDRESNN